MEHFQGFERHNTFLDESFVLTMKMLESIWFSSRKLKTYIEKKKKKTTLSHLLGFGEKHLGLICQLLNQVETNILTF